MINPKECWGCSKVYWISPGCATAADIMATAAMVYTMIAIRPSGPDFLEAFIAWE